MTNAQIAGSMKVTVRWVQELWRRHRNASADAVSHPLQMGRPENGMYGRREHSAVLSAVMQRRAGASMLHNLLFKAIFDQDYPNLGRLCNMLAGATALRHRIRQDTGINIPNGTIHSILRSEGMAREQPNKGKRRKWVRSDLV